MGDAAEPKEEPKEEVAAEAAAPVPQEAKPVVPGSMKNLYTYVPAAMVQPDFRDLAKTWPQWESATHEPPLVDGKVHFTYDGDYGSERVLVSSGRATIIPDDGSPSVTIGPGDSVYLHYGFACTWHVLEPMVQSYGYFDKDGVEIAENELTCDICGDDCFEESYLFNDETDICARCFKSDSKGAQEYEGAEYQREGKPAKAPPPKRSPGKDLLNPATKKAKSADYAPEMEDDDDDDDDDDDEYGAYDEPRKKKIVKPKPKPAPAPAAPVEPLATAVPVPVAADAAAAPVAPVATVAPVVAPEVPVAPPDVPVVAPVPEPVAAPPAEPAAPPVVEGA